MSPDRRTDLDWLRIALFLLLIFYHVGMFYVPWEWHVKSSYAPVEALELPMRLLNPWRIPALFVISGIALRFALDKVNSQGHSQGHSQSKFIWQRFVRLILPVLFGMAVICAPQAYLQLVADGVDTGNLVSFYLNYLVPPWLSPQHWTTITPTWNHLWYLVYVLLLTLLLVGIDTASSGRFRPTLDSMLGSLSQRPIIIVLIPMVVSFFILWALKESVGAVQMVWGDWHRLANSFWLMLFGFAIAKHAPSWSILWNCRWILTGVALILGAVLSMANLDWYWVGSDYDPHYYITRSFYSWCAILAMLGFVQALGRGSDKIRQYLSNAVFPYYVLHQTIIIMLGVWLGQFRLGLMLESLLLIVGTAIVTAALYHFLVRNIGRAALLFGGRNPS